MAEAVWERLLPLEPRSRVLHLGCGNGSQTLALASAGHRVLGLDDAEAPLSEARNAARAQRLNVHFLKSELHRIPYRAEFDAVVCLSGSFGRISGDARALESARRALKPGGRLLLDLPNKEWVVRHLESHASFDLETGRLRSHRASERVYTLTEIKALLAQAGLAYRKSWGAADGEPYGLDSRRLVVLAQKPAEERSRKPAEELVRALRIKGRRKGR